MWTGGFDRAARCWNATTGKLSRTLKHEHRVQALALSPDGRSLVTASDGTAQLWDAASGKAIGNPQVFDDSIWSVAFSPDSRRVVVGTNHGSGRLAVLLDAGTGLRVDAPKSHEDGISAIAFALNGTVLLTATTKGSIQRWDLADGTQTPFHVNSGHTAQVGFIKVSPNGKTAVTGDWDGTARLWDLETFTLLGAAMQHRDRVLCAAFSPDNALVLTGCDDATARFWDTQTGEPRSPPLRHGRKVANSVHKVAFRPDGKIAATMASCSCAWLWNVKEVCSREAQGKTISRQGGILPPSPIDENSSEDENPLID